MAAAHAESSGTRTPSNVYLFEAKGVQRWLFDSGPLRDLIGASDLVAGLAASDGDDLLSEVLSATGLAEKVRFSRRAGGAFCIHSQSREALDRFRAAWRLAVGLRCPGLECSDAGPIGADSEVEGVNLAYRALGGTRFNDATTLPPAGHPFTLFNPRTGRLSTRAFDYDGDRTLVDVVSEGHREHADELASTFTRLNRHDRVARRFLSDDKLAEKPPYAFPRNLETNERDYFENPMFPFRRGDDRRIAVVHVDLSGLGEVFRKVNKTARNSDDIKDVADAIEGVVQGSAQTATAELLDFAELRDYGLRVIPGRPVLLGGDDITILLRADLAFRFATTLLTEIEKQSERAFEAFAHRGLSKVSACAGIAIVKAGQPFLMANALADSLVRSAKRAAKQRGGAPYPSFLAFHVSQSTLREDYEAIVARELSANGALLTANPYRMDSTPESNERG